MTNPAKPVAKSLHTLTVLQQVARIFTNDYYALKPEPAMDKAMTVLGLAGRPDPYGLKARALELMTKESRLG